MTTPTPDPVFDFLEDDSITVPGIKSRAHPDGKDYRIESPDVDTGLFLTRLQTHTRAVEAARQKGEEPPELDAEARRIQRFLDAFEEGAEPDDEDGVDAAKQSARLILGRTFDELAADGVSWARVRAITQYAYVAFVNGVDAANQAALEGAFSGKAAAPGNRATRRSAQRGRTGSTGTSPRRAPRPR